MKSGFIHLIYSYSQSLSAEFHNQSIKLIVVQVYLRGIKRIFCFDCQTYYYKTKEKRILLRTKLYLYFELLSTSNNVYLQLFEYYLNVQFQLLISIYLVLFFQLKTEI